MGTARELVSLSGVWPGSSRVSMSICIVSCSIKNAYRHAVAASQSSWRVLLPCCWSGDYYVRNVWKIYPTNPLSIGILAIRKVNGLEKRYVEERGGKGGGGNQMVEIVHHYPAQSRHPRPRSRWRPSTTVSRCSTLKEPFEMRLY